MSLVFLSPFGDEGNKRRVAAIIHPISLSAISRISISKKYKSSNLEYFLLGFPSEPEWSRLENFQIKNTDAIRRIPTTAPVLITSK